VRGEICHRAQSYPDAGELGSPECWAAFLRHCGARLLPAPGSLDAVALHHGRHGWFVIYNADASPERLCRMFAHELAEIVFTEMDTPSDPCPHRPDEVPLSVWRHLVSEQVVRLIFD
jgi:hypothetical protein